MEIILPRLIFNRPSLPKIRTTTSKGFRRNSFKEFRAKLIYKCSVTIWKRTILSSMQNHRCCWCGIYTTEEPGYKNSATIEHIIPKHHGGSDRLKNLAMSCLRCNNTRGTMDIDKFIEIIKSSTNLETKNTPKFRKGNSKTRRNISRKIILKEVMAALLQAASNPFEVDTPHWKTFMRLSNSENIQYFLQKRTLPNGRLPSGL